MDQWNPNAYDAKFGVITAYGAGLIEILDPQPGERILDLGCGTGHLTRAIAERGAVAVGLDRSPAMVAEARRQYPELAFVEADGADFALPQPLVFPRCRRVRYPVGAAGLPGRLYRALRSPHAHR